jgi:hypothetical protein
VNPIRAYLDYLYRKAAVDPSAVAIAWGWYAAPWLSLLLLMIVADSVLHFTPVQRVWIGLPVAAVALAGVSIVTVVFIRESMAAARREPPRYSE